MSRTWSNAWVQDLGGLTLPSTATLKISFGGWMRINTGLNFNVGNYYTAFSLDPGDSGAGLAYIQFANYADTNEGWKEIVYMNTVGGNSTYEPIFDGGDGTNYFSASSPSSNPDTRVAMTFFMIVIDNTQTLANEVREYHRQGNIFVTTVPTPPGQILPTSIDQTIPITSILFGQDGTHSSQYQGIFGPRYLWVGTALTGAQVRKQSQQVRPIIRDSTLRFFNPGGDSVPINDYSPAATNMTYSSGASIANFPLDPTNPPIPWEQSILLAA